MFFSKLFLAGLLALTGTTSVLASPVPSGSSSKAVAGSEVVKKGVNEVQVGTGDHDVIKRKHGSDDPAGDDRGGDRFDDDSDTDTDGDGYDTDSDSDDDWDDEWTRKLKLKRKEGADDGAAAVGDDSGKGADDAKKA